MMGKGDESPKIIFRTLYLIRSRPELNDPEF